MKQEDIESPPQKTTKSLSLFCWGVFAICYAAYRIHLGVVSVPGWIWVGFLSAFGVFDLLLWAITVFGKQWTDPQAAAKRTAARQKALFGVKQVYRAASSDDYRPLDQKFYAQKTQELLSLQFRQMREVVNETVSNTWPKNHTVLRGFLDPSGTIYASIYDVRLLGFVRVLQFIGVLPRKIQTVECETELSDGTFVGTSNTLEINKTLAPPYMHKTQFPANTSTETIVNEHRSQLAAVLASKPGVTATVCRDNTTVQAMKDRMNALRSAYRLSPDFDHHAEWEKVAGRKLTATDKQTVDLLKVEMSKDVRPA